MLDDMVLSDKLKVAQVWFERASNDDMPFTPYTTRRFGELLQQCQHEAAMLAANLDIAHATIALLEGRKELARLERDASNLDVQRAATLEGGAG
jgi:hypothetical protein